MSAINPSEGEALSAAAVALKVTGMHDTAEAITKLHLRLDAAADDPKELETVYQDGFAQGRFLGQREGRNAALLDVVAVQPPTKETTAEVATTSCGDLAASRTDWCSGLGQSHCCMLAAGHSGAHVCGVCTVTW
jgi:hypothetical protein